MMAVEKRAQDAPAADELVKEQGERCYDAIADELHSKYPTGHVVVINLGNGAYVVGSSHREAVHKFTSTFGDAPGWMRRIGA